MEVLATHWLAGHLLVHSPPISTKDLGGVGKYVQEAFIPFEPLGRLKSTNILAPLSWESASDVGRYVYAPCWPPSLRVRDGPNIPRLPEYCH